jgi:hypothetical protein
MIMQTNSIPVRYLDENRPFSNQTGLHWLITRLTRCNLQLEILYFYFTRKNYFHNKNWGEFHKSWAHGLKHKGHPNLGENTISWVQGSKNDAKLGKKDGRRAQISSIEPKSLYEIHPWFKVTLNE